MKKVTLILLVLILALGASGGYGYYILVLEDDDDQVIEENSGNSYPIAKISPSNPKIQANETVVFFRENNYNRTVSFCQERNKWNLHVCFFS